MKTDVKTAIIRQIAQLGDPVIRKKAIPVVNVKSDKIQALIADLIATAKDSDGVGIAAPQVYQSVRLFIVASHPNPKYPNAPNMKPLAVVNPEITKKSKEKTFDWEGCLSIPGIRAKVPRHLTTEVSFTTVSGKKVKKSFSGFVSRIFQHEYDHLEGIVFLDRVKNTRDIVTEKEYQKIIRKK